MQTPNTCWVQSMGWVLGAGCWLQSMGWVLRAGCLVPEARRPGPLLVQTSIAAERRGIEMDCYLGSACAHASMCMSVCSCVYSLHRPIGHRRDGTQPNGRLNPPVHKPGHRGKDDALSVQGRSIVPGPPRMPLWVGQKPRMR